MSKQEVSSDFSKKVEEFAKEMKESSMSDENNRSLIVLSTNEVGDHNENVGAMMGNKGAIIHALVNAMKEPEIAEVMQEAINVHRIKNIFERRERPASSEMHNPLHDLINGILNDLKK